MPHQPPALRATAGVDVIVVPGWKNSGPRHWQTRWEHRFPQWQRVQQADWQTPRRHDWVATLDAAIAGRARPILLVAHSLGCVTVAHWAESTRQAGRIAGAFLVAPADVERSSVAHALADFAPLPRQRLPFPALVVGSDNDPACSATRAAGLAAAWGAGFQLLQGAGHINADSGLGDWEDGQERLAAWLRQARRSLPARRVA